MCRGAPRLLANSQIGSAARREAIHSIKSAQQGAMEDRNKATAGRRARHQGQQRKHLFDADREAREADGEAFLRNGGVERLATGLAKSNRSWSLTVSMARMAIIDLRSLDAGGAGRGAAARRDIVLPGQKLSPDDDEPPRPALSSTQDQR